MVGDALSGRITNYLIDMYSKDQSPEIGYTASGKPFKIQNTQEQPADKTHANTDFFGSEIELSHIVTEKALRWGITKARASSVIYMEIVRGELIDVLKVMTADENFSRFIQRMMFLDQVHASAQEAKDAIVQQLAKDARDCRVYGYPASSQNEIVEQAAAYSTAGEGTITLSPAKYTKTGFFMHRCLESSDSYYTGFFDLQPQGVTDEIVQKFRVLLRCKPKEFDKQASRAYYKLDEAFRRTDIVHWMTESVGDNVAEGETRTYSKVR
ncbi:hypothetical protein SARC_01480 [Sphaeroforma arctica JP610]|uniref:Uncharacterized protein n=1 Tax=Sphaeroforma arctica JP610 TaxID=667725 RepID=A0A0L0GBK6_9EUKA|nr:hypothetical protein SARC_01480 [Sphaeroforma arctica JP610]KNC86385.1 hypothetical protein SARC_01480 [Sphaeroforma arctica JP610]|eukprot:XP_014160287.1 hypothetical protein SARC_01480 [Sphaeroforma arctica JP610]